MYVIGIDCGTSSLKGIVMNKQGHILASASQEYETTYPQLGFCEQNPEDWYDACIGVLKNLFQQNQDYATQCDGISFSGQMHTMVVLDEHDKVLRPAILWNDVRTSQQTQKLNNQDLESLLNITQNRAVEGFTLPKLLWVQEHEPEIYRRIQSILLPKDYLRFRLTGFKHMDYSDAAGTLMMDLKSQTWSEALASKFGYELKWLPQLVESFDFVGLMNPESMRKLEINKPIQMYAGGADNACAAFASGVKDDTTGLISIGTSGVMLRMEEKCQDYGGQVHFFNGVQNFYAMGVTLSAGDALKWAKGIFGPSKSYDELLEGIENIPPGSEGLLFSPYLNGERTPHFDAAIRGSFVGLDTRHTQSHLLRSIIEGITFSLRDSLEIFNTTQTQPLTTLVSTGGGAKNPLWLQMQADIMNLRIQTLKVEEGPALGAALIAAVGAQWYANIEECIYTCVHYDSFYEPNKLHVDVYTEFYRIYRDIYHAHKDISHKLVALRSHKTA